MTKGRCITIPGDVEMLLNATAADNSVTLSVGIPRDDLKGVREGETVLMETAAGLQKFVAVKVDEYDERLYLVPVMMQEN